MYCRFLYFILFRETLKYIKVEYIQDNIVQIVIVNQLGCVKLTRVVNQQPISSQLNMKYLKYNLKP